MISDEEKNRLQRKNEPLTFDEWFDFFILPLNPSSRYFRAKDSNDFEEERFLKHGFDTKLKQSKIARLMGVIFWIIVLFGGIRVIDYYL